MKFLHFNLFIFLFSFFGSSGLFAQRLDSVQRLNEVTVTSSKIKHFNVGNQVITLDSVSKDLHRSNYLGNILSETAALTVKANGVGFTSISSRAAGSSHTPVLWNGFNLEDIMGLGVDASQLPTIFFENISVQLGGSSALFGSGAIGGAVHLSNSAYFNQALKVDLGSSFGSFGNFFESFGLKYGNSHYATSLKLFYNGAKNDFPFSGSSNNFHVNTNQFNAGFKQFGLMSNNYFKLSQNQNINVNLWMQRSDRDIAPTLSDFMYGSVDSMKNQVDDILRLSGEYSLLLGDFSLKARSGLFNSKQNFVSSSYGSEGKTMLSISELEASYSPVSFLKLNGGLNYTYEEANTPSYPDIKVRNRIALFSSVKAANENSEAVLNLRTESVNQTFIPVTFSFGLQQAYFDKFLVLHANVSKNYKLPSFNDLYYWGSGNPDLKPESGLNYEGGLTFQFTVPAGDFKLNTTVFHSDMENWIRWIPVTMDFWQPFNLDKVKMDGLENSLEYKKTFAAWTLGMKGMYTYTAAENVNSGTKLPYTPEHKASGTATVFYKTFMFRVQEQYQSQLLYGSETNYSSLPRVALTNVAFAYGYAFKGISMKANLQVNNLLNKDYMQSEGYPMPRRNFMVGLSVEL
ncbi:MAG TPA: TonB-dependent receptor [Bacteroidales bacterium]|nr:TonB-dependent receptor [Bacteroidales bacterium]